MSTVVERRDRPLILDPADTSLIEPDDVVVLLLWHLGDVLNCTAFFPALAARHPGKLALATTRACLPLVQHNPHLSKIFVIGVDIPGTLSFEDFDRVRDMAATYFSRNTVHNLHIPIYLRNLPGHYLDCWRRALGVDTAMSDLRPEYFPAREAKAVRHDVVVLGNGGAVGAIKRWPPARWQALVGRLRRTFPSLRLVQMGSTADPPIAGVEDLRGKTNIDETYHLLQSAAGCISNDSFLAHFAVAADCSTYVMYGHSSPQQFRPLGVGDVVTLRAGLPCSPCYRMWCQWSLGLYHCLAFPSVQRVFDAVAQGLKSRRDVESRPA